MVDQSTDRAESPSLSSSDKTANPRACEMTSPISEWQTYAHQRIGQKLEETAQCPNCKDIDAYIIDLSISHFNRSG